MSATGKQCLKEEDNAAPVLEGRNLRVEYSGNPVLDIERIAVGSGEVLSLVGPNGAGKSTLLAALCMLTKSLDGSVLFRGKKISENISVDAYRRRTAMVFQEALLFNTTVFDNIASGLKFRAIARSNIRSIVNENLERFGISHLKNRSAKTLSGGEAQRVSLARAFAISPDILFLDEPFSALDPPSREALVTDFEAIIRASRTTAIFATHDRVEALRLSDRMAVMDKGRIIQAGRPDDVMNHPANEFVASFVGIEIILKGVVKDRDEGSIMVEVSGHTIEAAGDNLAGENVMLCIRPENVIISANRSDTRTSARNHFSGIIEKVRPLGSFYRVDMDCGFPLVAYITKHSMEEMSLNAGKKIEASFKATAVHVLKAKG